MPVSLFLTPEQLDVVNLANKSKKVPFRCTRNSLELTHENWEQVRDLVKALHTKKFNIKTKTVENLETCYYASQVLDKIAGAENHFKHNPPRNDNAIGIVTNDTEEEQEQEEEETTSEAGDSDGAITSE
jgi:hypothetical protein